MAIGAFPVVKLGIMAFKQISKPIANVIKQRAKENLFFRQYVAMPPAHCKFQNTFIVSLYHILYIVLYFSLQLDGS